MGPNVNSRIFDTRNSTNHPKTLSMHVLIGPKTKRWCHAEGKVPTSQRTGDSSALFLHAAPSHRSCRHRRSTPSSRLSAPLPESTFQELSRAPGGLSQSPHPYRPRAKEKRGRERTRVAAEPRLAPVSPPRPATNVGRDPAIRAMPISSSKPAVLVAEEKTSRSRNLYHFVRGAKNDNFIHFREDEVGGRQLHSRSWGRPARCCSRRSRGGGAADRHEYRPPPPSPPIRKDPRLLLPFPPPSPAPFYLRFASTRHYSESTC